MDNREVVLIEGVRTAFGRLGGSLKDITAEELAGIGIKGLLEKTKIHKKAHIDSVYLGTALGCSRAVNPARWALLYAGLDFSTTASYVEMQCGSAIDSINHAAWKILCGHADIMIAGGMESYSQIPARFSQSTQPYKLLPPQYLEPQLQPIPFDGFMYGPSNMGLTAENLQVKYNIPREEQDEFSFRSQSHAKQAIDNGYFEKEIIPVMVSQGKKGPPLEFKIDEHPRLTPVEKLASLKPAFKEGGTVTAGNSSGRNDGAAFILMMTRKKAKELEYEPRAKWVASGEFGVDPAIMGIAPAYAMPIAIRRANLKLSDMDVIECNEAFAVQNLAVIRELEIQMSEKVNMENWNPNGGAIAFGHPNGASGGRICMLTINELIRRNGRYGIFSSCCGGGLGVATVIENLLR